VLIFSPAEHRSSFGRNPVSVLGGPGFHLCPKADCYDRLLVVFYKFRFYLRLISLFLHIVKKLIILIIYKSRDSSVGIALGCGLDDRGSMVRFSEGAGNFSLHHRVQDGSGAHPASYPVGTGGSFPGGKAAGP
jgi:hypothetical protein